MSRGEAEPSTLECDVCIVGTGPAGSTLARELSGTGLSVLVLESGTAARNPDADALNEVENVGRARTLDQWLVRNRILGGSSHSWTGRCAPFDEVDFERRSWVPHSGWPINLDDLTPYLERSAPFLGLAFGTGFTDERFWQLAGRRPPTSATSDRKVLPFFWQSSRDETNRRDFMRFGPHLQQHLGANVRLLTNCTVLRIHTDDSGSAVRSVEISDAAERRMRVNTRTAVLCTGAIENARLLLSSNTTVPAGLGNHSDLVGRFLMDHPRDTVGTFPRLSRRIQKLFGVYRLSANAASNLFRRGFRLNPAVQRAEGLLNCAAFLREVPIDDDPWTAFIRLMNRSRHSRRELGTIVRRPHHFLRASYNYFLSRRPMPHALSRLELVCMCEQVPDPESRISLGEKRDRFGMRLPRVHWLSHADEARTVRHMARFVRAEFESLRLEAPVLDGWISRHEPFPEGSFLDVAHPMGTTRMSADPRSGVVDQHGEVHGVRGLFVAGSSIFPTSGHCNPTQMIVALAIRLADTLKARSAP